MSHEKPHSRYTRDKTWAALYSQCYLAGYALVPYTATQNSVMLIRFDTPDAGLDLHTWLLTHTDECKALEYQTVSQRASELKRAAQAVILARSSDYYYYHLSDRVEFRLVVCGLHDSYLASLPVLEMSTNKRYEKRETKIVIEDTPAFEVARKTQVGHAILLGALVAGDTTAIAFLNGLKQRSERSYWRIRSEVDVLQHKRYVGAPLAFQSETMRLERAEKISTAMIRYYYEHPKRRRLSE